MHADGRRRSTTLAPTEAGRVVTSEDLLVPTRRRGPWPLPGLGPSHDRRSRPVGRCPVWRTRGRRGSSHRPPRGPRGGPRRSSGRCIGAHEGLPEGDPNRRGWAGLRSRGHVPTWRLAIALELPRHGSRFVKSRVSDADSMMAMEASVSSIGRRRAEQRWPPSAESVGIDLSLPALLLIFGGLTFLGYLYVWAAPLDRGLPPWVRWRTAGDVVELSVWLGMVGFLGWRKAVGLVIGTFSWLGVLPVVALTVGSLAAADLAGKARVGPGLQFLTVIAVLAAAMTEEIIFRGFLFHGLTRRLGGRAAMFACSLLFALYHVPRGVREGWSGEFMVFSLISFFTIGMYLCRVRAQTGSILLPTAIHTMLNLTLTGVWIWAIPGGSFPSSFAWILLALRVTGLLIAARLLVRATPRSARALVCGPPDEKGRFGRDEMDWRSIRNLYLRPPSPPALERFTERARRAVVLAGEEASSEGAAAVGTEHLLVGLLHEGDGAAAAALREWHIPLGDPARLEELQADRDHDAPSLPFAKSARSALQLAGLEADAWEEWHIGTDHLLVGVTAFRRNEAARILRRRRVNPLWLRTTTLRLMSERGSLPWPPQRSAPSESTATDVSP
jgi:membrane protease YdiL (CAAX protease family)